MQTMNLIISGTVIMVLLSFTIINSVVASSVMWNQTYGSGDHEVAQRVIETSDKG